MNQLHLLKENERIILELHSDQKRIECNFKTANSLRIIVENAIALNYEHEEHIKSVQQYYRSEIKQIHRIELEQEVVNEINDDETFNENFVSHDGLCDKKSFDQHEIKQIKWLISNAVYISQFDSHYYTALEDIKYQECVGLRAENMLGRLNLTAPLICIYTSNKVYLFDMLRMGKLHAELKDVFQSDLPRKVIYGSSLIADYLLHKESCKLNGVVDVMVFHLMIKKIRHPVTFEECLSTYFALRNSGNTIPDMDYYSRPLSEKAKKLAAFKVIMVLKMYYHFLHDILLKPIMLASQNVSNSYENVNNQVDLMTKLNGGDNEAINNLDLDSLDSFFGACSIFDSD